MRGRVTTAILTTGLVAIGGAWHHFHAADEGPRISFVAAGRGDVTRSVACTGTLQPASSVTVGSQVSGTVTELGADFNSVVHKDQVLARLDLSLFDARVQQAKAALEVAAAKVEADRAAVADATEKQQRASALVTRQLIPQSDADDAMVALHQAEAQLHADEGAVLAARGAVDQSEVDRSHAVVRSPVDGVVIARNVDVGQTVAAGFQAPELFSVATDLTRLELQADVDESEIGRVQVGQRARFSVDAYPNREFQGSVTQVRLQPTVVQNVVTYTVVVAVDNRELQLRPGMTATVTIDVATHRNALRIPTVALIFRPSEVVLRGLREDSLLRASAPAPSMFLPGAAAQVWVGRGGRIEPQMVHVGLSDGRYTEVMDGLTDGEAVVVSAFAAPAPRVSSTASPLAPRPRWR